MIKNIVAFICIIIIFGGGYLIGYVLNEPECKINCKCPDKPDKVEEQAQPRVEVCSLTEEIVMEKYVNKSYDYEIEYPKGWTYTESQEQKCLDNDSESGGCYKYPAGSFVTFTNPNNEYVDFYISVDPIGAESFDLENNSLVTPFKINGQDGKKALVSCSFGDSGFMTCLKGYDEFKTFVTYFNDFEKTNLGSEGMNGYATLEVEGSHFIDITGRFINKSYGRQDINSEYTPCYEGIFDRMASSFKML